MNIRKKILSTFLMAVMLLPAASSFAADQVAGPDPSGQPTTTEPKPAVLPPDPIISGPGAAKSGPLQAGEAKPRPGVTRIVPILLDNGDPLLDPKPRPVSLGEAKPSDNPANAGTAKPLAPNPGGTKPLNSVTPKSGDSSPEIKGKMDFGPDHGPIISKDFNGNTITTEVSFGEEITTFYDRKGNRLWEQTIHQDGSSTTIFYNLDGSIKEIKNLDKDGKPIKK
jgi:hypothetical protein